MKIQEALIKAYEILKSVQIDSYKLDSQLLLCKIINKDKLFLIINNSYVLNEEEVKTFFELIEIRKRKMPTKYILGECEFMGLNFHVEEGVLIPRPDTEILVESAIESIKENNYKKVCDVCSGSGIIGLTIAKFLEFTEVKCFDISKIALRVTENNIRRLMVHDRVSVFESDLLTYSIDNCEKYDIIVSNPPYIRADVIPSLMEDVKNYEPYEALCGGEDGLYFYKKIIEQSLKVLKNKGTIAFEIGYDQKDEVSDLLHQNGFMSIECYKDLYGNDRVVKAKLQ